MNSNRRDFLSLGMGAALASVPGFVSSQESGRLTSIGSTRGLEILPLVDWQTASPQLRGEAGVSYLVRTDGHTVLFDVGGNFQEAELSPLIANMNQLGVDLRTVDTIVISHAHGDHVGGQRFARQQRFALGGEPPDALRGKRVIVPVPLDHAGVEPIVAREPLHLAPGVTTTGILPGRLHIGPIDEMALAARVAGKGIVLIVGCGHQGLRRLLERTTQQFEEPLFGLIGGLHFPVPSGRLKSGGVDLQRWATYGFGAGPSLEDVQREIDGLRSRGVQWVSLSPHDSSDEVIELFRSSFGTAYHDLRVGERQVIAALAP